MEFGIEIPTRKPFDAVALGLNAVDHLIVVPRYPEFNSKIQLLSHTLAVGGQCATAMVALARLGMRTRYIGKVGSDDLGQIQIDSLVAEGVDAGGVVTVKSAESQTAFIIIDKATGERTIIWQRDPSLTILPQEVDYDKVTSGRVLLVDGHDVAASIRAAEYAKSAGIPTVLDIDHFYEGAENLLPLIDFNICSSDFPARATGETDLKLALKKLHDRTGSRFVTSTIGSKGALAYCQGEYIHSPAFEVECRDSTGAGDAFHGGFIFGLLSGLTIEGTLRFAHAVAALKCRAVGARTALPMLEEVNAFLNARSE
jgi:sugar/nucleoside kinase (ribokinase family)